PTHTAFHATITWGDGLTSDGEIVPGPNNTYTVRGKHLYLSQAHQVYGTTLAGAYGIEVLVEYGDPVEQSVTLHGTVWVEDAPRTASPPDWMAADNVPLVAGLVGKFQDDNPYEPADAYSARVFWGDRPDPDEPTVLGYGGKFFVPTDHNFRFPGE